MSIGDQIDVIQNEGARIVSIADATSLDHPVPSCPTWCLRDLIRHIGISHRWSTYIVGQRRHNEPDPTAFTQFVGPLPNDDQLSEWAMQGVLDLCDTLGKAPDDLRCWQSFAAPSSLEFWTRRQVHETTIHRVDAELTLGDEISEIHPLYALDGIDEMLMGFQSRSSTLLRTIRPTCIHLQASDVPHTRGDWYIHLSHMPPLVTSYPTLPPESAVRGPAELLYLSLWNRLPFQDLDCVGDRYPLQLWAELSPVVWSVPIDV
ncbi:maleylpyruvate isomerase family mycothiol-dependent enzyme [Haloglycomyces albus]|uniref:maleylpyruvate isomerase family mycothiol-dependent enzyme n=1 Tax=Haloglycomyces albus TaxID=526067 RepID=UPI00046CB63F|nr:maleylpyruvate isomerase family mycothiol-dependent enzyme [Haloglycomyces albus]